VKLCKTFTQNRQLLWSSYLQYKYEQKAWGRYSVMQKDVMERKNLVNGMGHKTEFSGVAGAKLVSIVIWTAHC